MKNLLKYSALVAVIVALTGCDEAAEKQAAPAVDETPSGADVGVGAGLLLEEQKVELDPEIMPEPVVLPKNPRIGFQADLTKLFANPFLVDEMASVENTWSMMSAEDADAERKAFLLQLITLGTAELKAAQSGIESIESAAKFQVEKLSKAFVKVQTQLNTPFVEADYMADANLVARAELVQQFMDEVAANTAP